VFYKFDNFFNYSKNWDRNSAVVKIWHVWTVVLTLYFVSFKVKHRNTLGASQGEVDQLKSVSLKILYVASEFDSRI
jgi:hypothetical protein